MSTFAQDVISSLEERWSEVESLITSAQNSSSEPRLYDALCRSAVVLMVAHFEGFIKACIKGIVEDINKFSRFGSLPLPLKKTYCTRLVQAADEEKDNKHLYQRVIKLVSVLDSSDIKLDHSYFLVANQYGNDQNNPKPELIEKICANFGIERFFARINNSDLDIVFEDERTAVQDLNSRLVEHLREGCKTYPYNLDSAIFRVTLDGKSTPKQQPLRTMWQSFLDEMHRQRHAIAHGTSLDNSSSPDEILLNVQKLRILQYVIMVILCENSFLPKAENL